MFKVVLTEGAFPPVRTLNGSPGYDFKASRKFIIPPGEQLVISTGVYVKIPVGWVGFIKSKKNTLYKRVCVKDCVVDTGEVRIFLHNYGKTTHYGNYGDTIAQMVITPCLLSHPIIVNDLNYAPP